MGEWDDPERKERVRKKVFSWISEGCATYIKDLPLDTAAKDELHTECVKEGLKKPLERQIELIESANSERANSEEKKKFVGFKILNPEVDINVRGYKEKEEEIIECETEAQKAGSPREREEFKRWCYSGIPTREPFEKSSGEKVGFKRLSFKTKSEMKDFDKNLDKPLDDEKKVLEQEEPDFSNSKSIFHAPNKVVEVSEDVEDESTQKETPLPPVHTITITRKFGIVPCDKTNTVAPPVFSRFEKVVNHLIRAGVALPDDAFEGKGVDCRKTVLRPSTQDSRDGRALAVAG